MDSEINTEINTADEKEKKRRGAGFISHLTTLVLLAICVLLAIAVCYKIVRPSDDKKAAMGGGMPGSMEQGAAKTDSLAKVYAVTAKKGSFVKTVRFYGTVKDEGDLINVSTTTAGYVTDILIKEGDLVKAGAIVGYVDPSKPGAVYQKSPVKAAVGGRIESVPAAVGQYLSAYGVFATEKTGTEYKIKLNIPEKYIDNIKIGTKAIIASSVRSDLHTDAYVCDIEDDINENTRTFEVEFKASDESLFASGLALTMDVVTESLDDCITVPDESIFTLGNQDYVYVVVDGKASERKVECGSDNNSETVILSGLSEGDVVITDGSVSDGSAVKIIER